MTWVILPCPVSISIAGKPPGSLRGDPVSGGEVSLYNPREDEWEQHFIWSEDGLRIVGITAPGRATVVALDLNRERAINIRSADRAVGRHPPGHDPLQKTK